MGRTTLGLVAFALLTACAPLAAHARTLPEHSTRAASRALAAHTSDTFYQATVTTDFGFGAQQFDFDGFRRTVANFAQVDPTLVVVYSFYGLWTGGSRCEWYVVFADAAQCDSFLDVCRTSAYPIFEGSDVPALQQQAGSVRVQNAVREDKPRSQVSSEMLAVLESAGDASVSAAPAEATTTTQQAPPAQPAAEPRKADAKPAAAKPSAPKTDDKKDDKKAESPQFKEPVEVTQEPPAPKAAAQQQKAKAPPSAAPKSGAKPAQPPADKKPKKEEAAKKDKPPADSKPSGGGGKGGSR